jgi:hypothetical protein
MPARSFALPCAILAAAVAVAGAAGFTPQGLASHTLLGTVTDTGGRPLPGTTVELSLPASTGSVRTMITEADGRYRFERVVPGLYVLTARLPGFGSTIRDLEIGDGDSEFQLNVQLKPSVGDDAIRVPAPSGPQRRVVCGLTMITPLNPDPKMIAPAQQPSPETPPFSDRLIPGPLLKSPEPQRLPVKPTLRTVQPTICWDPAPLPR